MKNKLIKLLAPLTLILSIALSNNAKAFIDFSSQIRDASYALYFYQVNVAGKAEWGQYAIKSSDINGDRYYNSACESVSSVCKALRLTCNNYMPNTYYNDSQDLEKCVGRLLPFAFYKCPNIKKDARYQGGLEGDGAMCW